MRLFLLILLVLVAFAANSILNRLAVDGGGADPGSFAVLRVASGCVVLLLLAWLQGRRLPLVARNRLIGAGSLAVYMIGFSIGYLTIHAGLGALFLFAVVQITMFAVSALRGAAPTGRQLAGAAIALGGLAVVLWPTGHWQVSGIGLLCMFAAGVGWGFYTLSGQQEPDALAATAANFLWCLPLTLVAPLIDGQPLHLNGQGAALAILSGSVTSGLGYALWYSVLPRITAIAAAMSMVAVPAIAVAGGVLLLGEPATLRFLFGSTLVLGGILLSFRRV